MLINCICSSIVFMNSNVCSSISQPWRDPTGLFQEDMLDRWDTLSWTLLQQLHWMLSFRQLIDGQTLVLSSSAVSMVTTPFAPKRRCLIWRCAEAPFCDGSIKSCLVYLEDRKTLTDAWTIQVIRRNTTKLENLTRIIPSISLPESRGTHDGLFVKWQQQIKPKGSVSSYRASLLKSTQSPLEGSSPEEHITNSRTQLLKLN